MTDSFFLCSNMKTFCPLPRIYNHFQPSVCKTRFPCLFRKLFNDTTQEIFPENQSIKWTAVVAGTPVEVTQSVFCSYGKNKSLIVKHFGLCSYKEKKTQNIFSNSKKGFTPINLYHLSIFWIPEPVKLLDNFFSFLLWLTLTDWHFTDLTEIINTEISIWRHVRVLIVPGALRGKKKFALAFHTRGKQKESENETAKFPQRAIAGPGRISPPICWVKIQTSGMSPI